MIDVAHLANALGAMGCDHPNATAKLVAEVLPDLLRSTGQQLTDDRAARYGHPRDNWRRIGQKWAATLDLPAPIPPELVGIMLMDVKTCRLVVTPNDPDSLDDLEGYAEAQRLLFGSHP